MSWPVKIFTDWLLQATVTWPCSVPASGLVWSGQCRQIGFRMCYIYSESGYDWDVSSSNRSIFFFKRKQRPTQGRLSCNSFRPGSIICPFFLNWNHYFVRRRQPCHFFLPENVAQTHTLFPGLLEAPEVVVPLHLLDLGIMMMSRCHDVMSHPLHVTEAHTGGQRAHLHLVSLLTLTGLTTLILVIRVQSQQATVTRISAMFRISVSYLYWQTSSQPGMSPSIRL